ncbi:MAG: hypothetical protein BWK80_44590 [Desulfobacteraceae bacterium IS3]|nr:MAG: hypothetical protein BWK80_44590 [Desulfobacteraceae bacterium IS3]HAO20940.1 hypothetical protein [Desulfobacteraceae bacterium]
MNIREAVIAFSQSEKIKSALIWVSNAVQSLQPADLPGGEKIITLFAEMAAAEFHVARRMAPDERWANAQRSMDTALVMLHSGAAQDAVFHLTKALSEVTGVAQQAMSLLKDQEIL